MEKDIRKHIITHDTAMDICHRILCILEKRKRKNEDGNKDEKNYVIQNDNMFFPFFFVRYVFHFFLYSVFTEFFDISEVISSFCLCHIFAIFLTLDSAIWSNCRW